MYTPSLHSPPTPPPGPPYFASKSFFKRACVDADADGDSPSPARFHNLPHAVSVSTLPGLIAYLVSAVFHRSDGQPVIEMDVRHKGNPDLLLTSSSATADSMSGTESERSHIPPPEVQNLGDGSPHHRFSYWSWIESDGLPPPMVKAIRSDFFRFRIGYHGTVPPLAYSSFRISLKAMTTIRIINNTKPTI